MIDVARASISIYVYGADSTEAAEGAEREWSGWLRDLFAGVERPA